MTRYITHEMVARVLRRLGIDPPVRFSPLDQDAQYTACRAEELPLYFDHYRSAGVSDDDKRVLCSFLLEGLNEYAMSGNHILHDAVVHALMDDEELHREELQHWMNTDDPDEECWWPATKELLRVRRQRGDKPASPATGLCQHPMGLPFHLSCDLDAPRLYQLRDGRFQLIDPIPAPPFMSGYRYLIVEEALAAFLADCGVERVRYEPAILFDRASGTEHGGHVQVHVNQFFKPQDIKDLALDGPRLLTMEDQHYFVSLDLKRLLERSPFTYLRFSEGLTGFAGAGA